MEKIKLNLQLFAEMNTNLTSSEGLSGEMKKYYSDYLIDNAAALGGLVSGILAGNSDVTDLFIDGTRKICGYDMVALDKFLADLEKIVRDSDLNVTITVSCAPEDATETMKKYL